MAKKKKTKTEAKSKKTTKAAPTGQWQRYELQEGKTAKFWAICVIGSEFTTQWGHIGKEGQQKLKSHGSPQAAQAAAKKLVAQKVKKGYTPAAKGAKATKKTVGKPKRSEPSAESAQATDALRATIRKRLKGTGLEPYEDEIVRVARPSYLLKVRPTQRKDAPTTSRLGGKPALPCEMGWPVEDQRKRYGAEDPRFMAFLGQINLDEVPGLDGPLTTGLLSVFGEQTDISKNPLRLHHFENVGLQTREPPPDSLYFDEDHSTLGSLTITKFVPTVSLPDSLTKGLKFKIPEDLLDTYSDVAASFDSLPSQKEPTSRFLGFPYDPYGQFSLKDTLLLEVQSHFSKGECYMNFWDAGCFFVTLPKKDWERGDLRKAQANIFSM